MWRFGLFLALAGGTAGGAAYGSPSATESARTEWFREAKFGLFIHWGLYSVPAGIYHGQAVFRGPGEPGSGEWILHDSHMPVAEYKRYARQFDPVKFDARRWVAIAKAAGMRYIVITAKHHDGFAMFRSRASAFNIVEATPFGRDPLQELAAACREAGLRLGFYYSQAQDWTHPGGASWAPPGPMYGGDPARGHWDPAQDGDFDTYLDQVGIPQVRELLTNYGPISILWWDTPVGMTPARAARFADVLKLQPQTMTNNRLLDPVHPNPYSGDTSTPEQTIPAAHLDDRLFEVCMTMNDTWGYKARDQNWKSAADLTRKLIDIVSKGGNFLLNVGPNAAGEFPAPSVERLAEIGRWMNVNHEAVYGTTSSRFRQPFWGRSTTKGRALYLEVFYWPSDGRLVIPGLEFPPVKVSMLAGDTPLAAAWAHKELVVTVPRQAPDPVATVIKLEFDRSPQVDQPLVAQDLHGAIRLPASIAVVANAYGGNARVEQSSTGIDLRHWDRLGTSAAWRFDCTRPGRYALEVEVNASGRPVFAYGLADALQRSAPVAPTGSGFRWVNLGPLVLTRRGEQTVTVKWLGGDGTDLQLRGARLSPAR